MPMRSILLSSLIIGATSALIAPTLTRAQVASATRIPSSAQMLGRVPVKPSKSTLSTNWWQEEKQAKQKPAAKSVAARKTPVRAPPVKRTPVAKKAIAKKAPVARKAPGRGSTFTANGKAVKSKVETYAERAKREAAELGKASKKASVVKKTPIVRKAPVAKKAPIVKKAPAARAAPVKRTPVAKKAPIVKKAPAARTPVKKAPVRAAGRVVPTRAAAGSQKQGTSLATKFEDAFAPIFVPSREANRRPDLKAKARK